jgi:predicted transcriptional regulator
MKKIEMTVPFFQAPNDIFDIGLGKFELLVYLYLARCANNNEKAYPSLNTIADKTSISRSSVQKAIKGLEEKKLIVKKKHKTDYNRYYNNTYMVEANLTKDMFSQNTGMFYDGIGIVSENIEVCSDNTTINNYNKKNYKEITNKEYLHDSKEVAYIAFNDLNDEDYVKQTNNIISSNRSKIAKYNYNKAHSKIVDVITECGKDNYYKYIYKYLDDKQTGRSVENFIEHLNRYEKEL